MRLFAARAALALLLATPAFAQAPQPSFARSAVPSVRAPGWTVPSAAQPYVPAEPAMFDAGLPTNLVVPDRIMPLVETMWRRSPTFRRQCARLSSARGLTVAINIGQAPEVASARARTQVLTTSKGRMEAVVHIKPPDDIVELIAHEIEHVIEQLDGVDLSKRTAGGDESVSYTDHQAYETRRARETGLRVAHEARDFGG